MGAGGGSGAGGLLGSGKQTASKDFKVSGAAKYGEADTLNKLRAVSMGQTPTMGQQYMTMFNDQAAQQAMALAASQRGASNPALAFRQAQIGNQQMGLQNAQQASIQAIQERQMADQMILSQAAAQRGVALNSAMANQNAQFQANKTGLEVAAGLGQAAMGAAGPAGAAKKFNGGKVEGEPNVEGDSPVNDTEPHMLSPGEIVVPRSAAKDEESLKAFISSLKLEKGDKSSSEIGKIMAQISKLTDKVKKLEA